MIVNTLKIFGLNVQKITACLSCNTFTLENFKKKISDEPNVFFTDKHIKIMVGKIGDVVLEAHDQVADHRNSSTGKHSRSRVVPDKFRSRSYGFGRSNRANARHRT